MNINYSKIGTKEGVTKDVAENLIPLGKELPGEDTLAANARALVAAEVAAADISKANAVKVDVRGSVAVNGVRTLNVTVQPYTLALG